jgi:hypothetical protein
LKDFAGEIELSGIEMRFSQTKKRGSPDLRV